MYTWEGPAKIGKLVITASVAQGPGVIGGIFAIVLVVVAIAALAVIPVAPRGEDSENLQIQMGAEK